MQSLAVGNKKRRALCPPDRALGEGHLNGSRVPRLNVGCGRRPADRSTRRAIATWLDALHWPPAAIARGPRHESWHRIVAPRILRAWRSSAATVGGRRSCAGRQRLRRPKYRTRALRPTEERRVDAARLGARGLGSGIGIWANQVVQKRGAPTTSTSARLVHGQRLFRSDWSSCDLHDRWIQTGKRPSQIVEQKACDRDMVRQIVEHFIQHFPPRQKL